MERKKRANLLGTRSLQDEEIRDLAVIVARTSVNRLGARCGTSCRRRQSDPPSAVEGDKQELKRVMDRFKKAKGRWNSWSDLWEEIYDYVLPHRESFFRKAQQLDVPRIYTTRLLWLVFLSLLLVYNLASFRQMVVHSDFYPAPSFLTNSAANP